jgi:hypothetical protein
MRRHLSYANVAATLALVFAMSGGALAAKHYLIESTSQISPKVLKKLKGRAGASGRTGASGPAGPAGAAGAPGKDGAAGKDGARGPSDAFAASGNGAAFTETKSTLVSVNLPAGSFTLVAKTYANNNAGTRKESECELLGGTRLDSGFTRMEPEGNADTGTIVLATARTFAAATTVSLVCEASTTQGGWEVPTLVATQVDKVN